MMKLKKTKLLSILVMCVLFIQNFIFAISPSKVIYLSNETKMYVDRNGGITTNVIVIESNDGKKFFKECKKKLSMYDTVKRAINQYFGDKYKEEQRSILRSLANRNNFNKFFNMKTYGDGRVAKWLASENKSDTSVLGLTEPLNSWFKQNILPDFLHYAFAEIFQFRFNKNVKIGEVQFTQAVNNLATMRIANLLGLSDLVVKTEYVKIVHHEKGEKIGILMDCAQGVPFEKFKFIKNRNVKPSFQRALSNLMTLHAVCAQRDGAVGNYFTILEGNSAVSVNAFDHDMSFNEYVDLKKANFVLPCMILPDGKISLPHMDKVTAEKILNLSSRDIYTCLKDLLPNNLIDCVINRVNQIQAAIRKTRQDNKNFLLDEAQWSESTMAEELAINQDTYFKNFMSKLN